MHDKPWLLLAAEVLGPWICSLLFWLQSADHALLFN